MGGLIIRKILSIPNCIGPMSFFVALFFILFEFHLRLLPSTLAAGAPSPVSFLFFFFSEANGGHLLPQFLANHLLGSPPLQPPVSIWVFSTGTLLVDRCVVVWSFVWWWISCHHRNEIVEIALGTCYKPYYLLLSNS